MKVVVCTDSSSLIGEPAAALLGVQIVPTAVALDGQPVADHPRELDDLYEQMRAGAVATTSQPSPGAFADAYRRAAAHGAETVLSIHLDRRVSGTAASADLAAEEAPVAVLVVDVPTVSYGVALCVRAAVDALADGADAEAAAGTAVRRAATLDNVFAAKGARRGRVPGGGDEWSVLRFRNGAAEMLSTQASAHAAAESMAGLIRAQSPDGAAVGHADRAIEASADTLAHALRSQSAISVERYRVGASVGAHTGPDTFGAFWWPAR